MKKHSADNIEAFFALVRAGLWEGSLVQGEGVMVQGESLTFSDSIEWGEVYRLAQEQSVVGLVAAGIEHIQDVKGPLDISLSFAGDVLQVEHRNRAMNTFVAELMVKLRAAGVDALLVKGQGIAQCYERPLWRAAGDVDLLLEASDYEKAKEVLSILSDKIEDERTDRLHLAMTIGPWEVELHGTLRACIGLRIDRVIDAVQEDTFRHGRVRAWSCGDTEIVLPCADNDAIFVFTHIIQHFFKGGIGLRQVCDWCRLLWTFRDELDVALLEQRLREAGLLAEWKAFAALAVDWLGMPEDAMPLYSAYKRWSRKAKLIMSIILETGNFGQNKDISYREKCPYLVRKAISLWRHTWDCAKLSFIFPQDAIRAWKAMFADGVHRTSVGK